MEIRKWTTFAWLSTRVYILYTVSQENACKMYVGLCDGGEEALLSYHGGCEKHLRCKCPSRYHHWRGGLDGSRLNDVAYCPAHTIL